MTEPRLPDAALTDVDELDAEGRDADVAETDRTAAAGAAPLPGPRSLSAHAAGGAAGVSLVPRAKPRFPVWAWIVLGVGAPLVIGFGLFATALVLGGIALATDESVQESFVEGLEAGSDGTPLEEVVPEEEAPVEEAPPAELPVGPVALDATAQFGWPFELAGGEGWERTDESAGYVQYFDPASQCAVLTEVGTDYGYPSATNDHGASGYVAGATASGYLADAQDVQDAVAATSFLPYERAGEATQLEYLRNEVRYSWEGVPSTLTLFVRASPTSPQGPYAIIAVDCPTQDGETAAVADGLATSLTLVD
ncbi:hypothetical protein [Agromyces seonyuensis]|uniref:Uncharacterized protein n=1 Tax=Agromyces seonyuensis TaxID=2662446 RepID=A0A6I4NYK6_9MICO|nr:hypothetical protein [Agromyces seonyuensis]MWB99358.1 hypothetical protein [Agromyces seonyuensis]